MLYLKKIKTTLNYKNKETLYILFFLHVRFFLICYIFNFLNDFKLQKYKFFLAKQLKALK